MTIDQNILTHLHLILPWNFNLTLVQVSPMVVFENKTNIYIHYLFHYLFFESNIYMFLYLEPDSNTIMWFWQIRDPDYAEKKDHLLRFKRILITQVSKFQQYHFKRREGVCLNRNICPCSRMIGNHQSRCQAIYHKNLSIFILGLALLISRSRA